MHFFNSGKNLLTTITDTEKSTLNILRTHRKHNVKKCPFYNISILYSDWHFYEVNIRLFMNNILSVQTHAIRNISLTAGKQTS